MGKTVTDFFDFSELDKVLIPEGFASILGGFLSKMYPPPKLDEFQQRGWEKLGEGYYLAPIEMENNRNGYSHLYKGNEKLSDLVFRKGGMGGYWKGEYMQLIVYSKRPIEKTKTRRKPNEPLEVFDGGTHCVIDRSGKIVLKAEDMFKHPYLLGGCLADMHKSLINLKTGAVITKYDDNSVKSDEFLFVENKYDKNYPKGVYKVSFETGEFEIFPITDRK